MAFIFFCVLLLILSPSLLLLLMLLFRNIATHNKTSPCVVRACMQSRTTRRQNEKMQQKSKNIKHSNEGWMGKQQKHVYRIEAHAHIFNRITGSTLSFCYLLNSCSPLVTLYLFRTLQLFPPTLFTLWFFALDLCVCVLVCVRWPCSVPNSAYTKAEKPFLPHSLSPHACNVNQKWKVIC